MGISLSQGWGWEALFEMVLGLELELVAGGDTPGFLMVLDVWSGEWEGRFYGHCECLV